MKKTAIFLVICLTILGLAATTALAATSGKHIVAGGGVAEYTAYSVTLQFGFTAQQVDEQGNAKGELVMKGHDMNIRLKADIRYLWIFDNEALLGGYLTQSSDSSLPVGTSFILRVQDNGQGSKATELDKVSFPGLGFIDPATIDDPYSVMLSKGLNGIWTSGNIQVK